MLLPHLTNANIIAMIALALVATLIVALRSTHLTVFGMCIRALLVDIGAVVVVLAALLLPELVL